MQKIAVIVAAGAGTRLGGDVPKQFRLLDGRPVVWWSLKAFHDEDPATGLILVLPESYFGYWDNLNASLQKNGEGICHSIVAGGDTRTKSVANALDKIKKEFLLRDTSEISHKNLEIGRMRTRPEEMLIAVHDGARPLVTPEIIRRGWDKASSVGGVVPVIPVTDSLRELDEKGSRPVDRSRFVAVQTPQVFKASLLIDAYDHYMDDATQTFSDDAALVESFGFEVGLYDGSPSNIKVTNPGDIEIANIILNSSK